MASRSGAGGSASAKIPGAEDPAAEPGCPVCAALTPTPSWCVSTRWACVRSHGAGSCLVIAPQAHTAVLDGDDLGDLLQLIVAAEGVHGRPSTVSAMSDDGHGHARFAIRMADQPPEPDSDAVNLAAPRDSYLTVDVVLGLLRQIQRLSLYRPLVRVWARAENTNRRRAQVAPFYVLLWISVLLALLFSSDLWVGDRTLELVAAAIAAYRAVDIASFHSRLILSRSVADNTVAGYERNLILLAGNLVEVSLICAIWFRVAGSPTPLEAWYNGFLTTTLVSAPSVSQSLAAPPPGTAVASALTVATGLLLLLGGLSTLLSLIGRKFSEHGD